MDKAKSKSEQLPGDSHRIATSNEIEVSTYLEIAKEIGGEQPVAAKSTIP